jgi:hypothetical protein
MMLISLKNLIKMSVILKPEGLKDLGRDSCLAMRRASRKETYEQGEFACGSE